MSEVETTPEAVSTAPTPEKTFTQAELDRILADRLKRQKEQFADYDQLKTAREELDQIKAGQLSEQEKLQKKLETLEKKAAEAEAKALEKERMAQEILIRSAILSEAAKLGFADPEDAYLLLGTKPALGEDGQPVGVAEAVAALAEKRPYLLRQGTNQQRIPAEPFNPSGPSGPLKETDEQRRQRLYNKSGQVFDTAEAIKRGGGVVWNRKPE